MSTTTILITGANRGLGLGLLRIYLSRPNHIIIAAVRNPSHATSKALSELPTGEKSRLVVVKIDASNESDPFDAVKTLGKEGIEKIDIVIANAGVSYIWPSVKDLNVKDLEGHMVPNVYGVVWLYQATRGLLEKSENPIWATMGSSAGWVEGQLPITNAAYGPSKAAAHWLTKRIDAEEEKIAAVGLSPGWVQTDMGNAGAQFFGLKEAEVSVEVSCKGMVDVLGRVEKSAYGGKCWYYTGEESHW